MMTKTEFVQEMSARARVLHTGTIMEVPAGKKSARFGSSASLKRSLVIEL